MYDFCLAFHEMGHSVTLVGGEPFKPTKSETYPSINLGLNFMLIPSQGALGASAATLVAYIALFLFQGMCARKYTDLIGNSIRNIPFVLIGFLMYLLIRNISFGNGIMTVIVRVIIGGFVYLADSIVFVFIFRKRELNSFASYFNLTRGDKK